MDHRSTTVLVTGASSGLGEQFSRRFAERGANVVLVARRRQRLEELAGKTKADSGVNAVVYEQDVSYPGAGEELGRCSAAGSRAAQQRERRSLVRARSHIDDGR